MDSTPPDLDLVRADLSWLEEIMRLEALGFPREIRESREVFARRLEVFPAGFLVLPAIGAKGLPKDQDSPRILPQRSALAYFYAEVWAESHGEFSLEHDPLASLDPSGTVIYLASMTVDPALRGRGLGGQLFRTGLRRMKAEFPRAEKAVLMVREDWTGARRIYEAQGFRTTEVKSGILGPLPALIMERDLAGY